MNESGCMIAQKKGKHRNVAIRCFFRSNGSIHSLKGSWKMQKAVNVIIYVILVLLTIALFSEIFS
jgi:hypothetical protein